MARLLAMVLLQDMAIPTAAMEREMAMAVAVAMDPHLVMGKETLDMAVAVAMDIHHQPMIPTRRVVAMDRHQATHLKVIQATHLKVIQDIHHLVMARVDIQSRAMEDTHLLAMAATQTAARLPAMMHMATGKAEEARTMTMTSTVLRRWAVADRDRVLDRRSEGSSKRWRLLGHRSSATKEPSVTTGRLG